MVFWGIAGVLTLICVILLIWPLLKQSTGRDNSTDYNMKVYEDQLSEVDRDFELGRVNSKELASIKTEIQRRILAENDTTKKYEEPKQFSPSTYIVFTLIISFAIPSFTIGIYANFGSPALPDIPFSQRTDLTAPNAVTKTSTQEKKPNEEHSGIDDMIANLKEKLRVKPDNIQNWELLGRTLLIKKQYDEAAASLRQAVSIFTNNPELRATYAEALVLAAKGRISREALKQFKLVSKSTPKDPRVRYYLGLADYQQSKIKEALARWNGLFKDTPNNAPWRNLLETRIKQASRDLGIEPDKTNEQLVANAETNSPNQNITGPSILKNGFRGPTSEDIRAAQTLSKNDRQAMINNMVQGLAEKLKDNPDNIDGWLRLSRSYKVLGKQKKSIEALKMAASLAPSRLDLQLEYARMLFPEGSSEMNITSEFKTLIKSILKKAPEHPEALYFGGMVAKAEGNSALAKNLWRQLLAKMGPKAPYRSIIERQIEDLQ